MERPLTDGELAEIDMRLAKASPGPWMRNGKTAAGWRIDDADPNRSGIVFLMTPTAIVPGDANAEFIAEARTDVEMLLTEVRRLKASVSKVANEENPKVEKCGMCEAGTRCPIHCR